MAHGLTSKHVHEDFSSDDSALQSEPIWRFMGPSNYLELGL